MKKHLERHGYSFRFQQGTIFACEDIKGQRDLGGGLSVFQMNQSVVCSCKPYDKISNVLSTKKTRDDTAKMKAFLDALDAPRKQKEYELQQITGEAKDEWKTINRISTSMATLKIKRDM